MSDFDLREQLLHSIQDADTNDQRELAAALRESLAECEARLNAPLEEVGI